MSKILVTHPGKIGDFLWALATVRLIAEKAGEKVTLLVPPGLAGVGELVKLQDYVEDVLVDKWWEVLDTAPATPRTPWAVSESKVKRTAALWDYDKVIDLGYYEWPKSSLARESHAIACLEGELAPLDLSRPWIKAPTAEEAGDEFAEFSYGEVSVGFTDEWGELKAGILLAVADKVGVPEADISHVATDYVPQPEPVCYEVLCQPGGRWDKEFGTPLAELSTVYVHTEGWVKSAYIIAGTQVFLGCLSSQAVLAYAMGIPRVLVEPNPHRHHPIFQHPDCPLVVGGDGLPTFDARHVADALRGKIKACGE